MYTTLSTPAPVCKVKCTSADKLRVKPPSMIANSFPQTWLTGICAEKTSKVEVGRTFVSLDVGVVML
jgi:hypothetical protein